MSAAIDPAAPSPADAEPSRTVEIELKFDVDDTVSLPDWTVLPGVTAVGDPELRDLDALYFDTLDFALAQRGYALRRRLGGPDAGWHIKGPRVRGARVEIGWPLGEEDPATAEAEGIGLVPALPDEVRAAVAEIVTGAVGPIARLRNARTAYALTDAAGGMVAEVVDDHVAALDARTGAERGWREWEVELGPAAPADDHERAAFFAAVVEAVSSAGGREAASASKLARALGY